MMRKGMAMRSARGGVDMMEMESSVMMAASPAMADSENAGQPPPASGTPAATSPTAALRRNFVATPTFEVVRVGASGRATVFLLPASIFHASHANAQ